MKKKLIIAVSVCLAAALLAAGCLYKLNGIYAIAARVRESIVDRIEYASMHRRTTDISGLEPLSDEPGAWYTQYHFISHSGGGIDGKLFTDSRQAWEQSYQNGNRVFDADLQFTSDGVLVLRHSWSDNLETGGVAIKDSTFQRSNDLGTMTFAAQQERLDYDTFMSEKIYGKYDPMSCEDMLRFMAGHEDLYVYCDAKNTRLDVFQQLVDTAGQLGLESVLSRVIVSVADFDLYGQIMDIYPFENAAMRQFPGAEQNYYELAAFCVENGVHAVTIGACYMDDEGARMLEQLGIHLYVAVVDYLSDMRAYRQAGATGAVSNWLYEPDWRYVS